MGGWRPSFAALLLLAARCVGEGSPTADSTPSPSIDAKSAFIDRVDDLCAPFGTADRKLTASEGRREAGRLLDRTIDAQEDFLRAAKKLDPPAAVARDFERFLTLLKEATSLRHRFVIETRSLGAGVEEDLRLAKTEDKLAALARELTLSSACPPIEEQFINFRLFTAKTNKACFDLYQKLKKSGVLKQDLSSRSSARAALTTLLDFEKRVAETIRKERKGITDARIDKLLKVLDQRIAVSNQLIADFDNYDISGYEADLKRYEALWKKLRKLTDDINIEACAYVVPKS